MSASGVGHMVHKRYKADITVGALKLPESRRIADLLLRHVDADGWKDAIVSKNILQARTPTTARRLTSLIRRRLETMGPDVWTLVRDGHGRVATHAVFSAAVKHSPLLGDFLQFVVGEQYRLFRPALSSTLFTQYLEGWLSVSNSLSGRHWELDQGPAVGDRTDIVQLGTGHHVSAGEGQRRVALQRRVAAYLVVGGQTLGATQRCLNPGFSERIGNSRRTGQWRQAAGAAEDLWLGIGPPDVWC